MSWQPYTPELSRLDLAEKRLVATGKPKEALAVDCLIEAVICRTDLRRDPSDKLAQRFMRTNARAYAAQLRVLKLKPSVARHTLIKGGVL